MISNRILITFALLGALSSQQSFGMQQVPEVVDGKTVLFYKYINRSNKRTDRNGKELSNSEAQDNLSRQAWPTFEQGYLYYNFDTNKFARYNGGSENLKIYTPQTLYPQSNPTTSTYQQTPTYSIYTQSNLTNPGYNQYPYQQTTQYNTYPQQQPTAPVDTNNTQQGHKLRKQEFQNINQQLPQTPQQSQIAQNLTKEFDTITRNYSNLNKNLSDKKTSTDKQQFLWDSKIDIQTYTYNLFKRAFENAGYNSEKNELWYAFMEYLLANGGLPRIEKTMLDRAMLYARKTAAGESLGSFEKLRHVIIPAVKQGAGEGFVAGGLSGIALGAGAAAVSHESGGRLEPAKYLPTAATTAAIGASVGTVKGAYEGYQRSRTLNVKGSAKENQESLLSRALQWIGVKGATKDEF